MILPPNQRDVVPCSGEQASRKASYRASTHYRYFHFDLWKSDCFRSTRGAPCQDFTRHHLFTTRSPGEYSTRQSCVRVD
ncbi:hypothetical protein PSAB6_260047 [Paraburkholderia sabiae]|nr:hypothetical protein PSAB6_260047 [Paraburkholderia sabiae]